MSKTQFSGVLSDQERREQMLKCLELIETGNPCKLGSKDASFVEDMLANTGDPEFMPSQRQLNWLKDIKDRC